MIWYDRAGNPLTLETAAKLLTDRTYVHVARTHIYNGHHVFKVSTVWLGLDHTHGDDDGRPVIFETIVFVGGNPSGSECHRYSTEQEARDGHTAVVAKIAAAITDPVIHDGLPA